MGFPAYAVVAQVWSQDQPSETLSYLDRDHLMAEIEL